MKTETERFQFPPSAVVAGLAAFALGLIVGDRQIGDWVTLLIGLILTALSSLLFLAFFAIGELNQVADAAAETLRKVAEAQKGDPGGSV